MRTHGQRGSALLNAMIMMLAMSVLAVGIIKFAGRGAASANADRNYAALVACADAGRQILQAQFRQLGRPANITLLNRSLDSTSGGLVQIRGGHIDGVSGVQVQQVEVLQTGALGKSRGGSGNITNVIGGIGNDSSLARSDLRVVVHCQSPGSNDPTQGRQLEVEFGVRLGT